MIGQAVLYAANRATHSAIDSVARRITWTAIAATFFLCALVFGLIAGYWYANRFVEPLLAAGIVAGGCVVIGLICLFAPSFIDWVKSLFERKRSPMQTAVGTAKEEAAEAVDYFGAFQVVGAAFLFGLGAARRLKQR
jgi:MFS family permease